MLSLPLKYRRPAALAGALLGLLALAALVTLAGWVHAGSALAKAHARYELTHRGWSFPAKLFSSAVPLSAGPKRLVAEARVRGYREQCQADAGPGTFCSKTGKVVPRHGGALEPWSLGFLLGPDGELREHLPLAEAPVALVDAIIASEDRDFREHSGVNFHALARAAFANAQDGAYAQGGSTLSMQVVRSLNQRSEKTLWRKVREMGLAVGLERALGKDGVLQMYLDAPYLGQQGALSICGFAAAAPHYFGKSIQELSLAQIATLVSILPAPAKLAPDRNPKAAKARRDRVLRTLAELYEYDIKAALEEPIATLTPAPLPERHPSYLSATRSWLEARLSASVVYGAGLQVETGIDLPAQAEAERLFPVKLRGFEKLLGKKPGPLQGAGLALDPQSGLLRAVYGGTDATSSTFNRATQARRQPGSSFKPLVYALAFSDPGKKFTAASVEPNSLRAFETPQGQWKPRNVGGEYTPTACLAQALAWSQNIATASLLEQLGGPAPLTALAKKVGFETSHFTQELGLALGQAEVAPVEMAQLAATVANGGFRVEARPVVRAVDAAGVERIAPASRGERVLSSEAAALTRDLMRLVVDYGTGGAARGAGGEPGYLGPMIGKTGTTDAEKDLWFVGSTPTLSMVVWLGYDAPATLGVSASDLAAPLWGWWMGRSMLYEGKPPDFSAEPKLFHQPICTESGKLPNPTCKAINAPFLPGTPPKETCAVQHPLTQGNGGSLHESLWKRLDRERTDGGISPGL